MARYKNLEMDAVGYAVKHPVRSEVLLHPDPNRINSRNVDLSRGQRLIYVTDGAIVIVELVSQDDDNITENRVHCIKFEANDYYLSQNCELRFFPEEDPHELKKVLIRY